MNSYDRVHISLSRAQYTGLRAARKLFDRRVERPTKSWGDYFTRQVRDDYGTLTALAQDIDRPSKMLESITPSIETGIGKLYLTISFYKGRPWEVLGNIGHSDPCIRSELEAICRLISLALRLGAPLQMIADQLRGISCSHILIKSPENGGSVKSLADAIAKVLSSVKDMDR